MNRVRAAHSKSRSNISAGERLSPVLLAQIWAEVVSFDETLAGFLASPVPVPDGTVIVSGSGKETFKTFNVSTAAALLAAACGATVVKGTSSSVSAVSGSSDVLAALGLPTLSDPAHIQAYVATYGIAMIDYASFCPRYAARYDGRFDFLSPMSFFMPAATLAVSADAFLHGLAHDDVRSAALGIRAARPDIARGRVVTTWIGPGQRIDELASLGITTSAVLQNGSVQLQRRRRGPATDLWQRTVRHRSDHASNAAALVESLSPDGDPALTELVERNAAAILATAHGGVGDDDALQLVREARLDGRAQRLLSRLRTATPKGIR
jgi:anthranilate phosphoribosyltransferase